METAIAQNLDDWSNQLKNLSSLRVKWHQQVDRMVNTLSSIKRWNHRLLLNTSIIILLTYFRDVLSFLLELPMFQGPSDYNWCKVSSLESESTVVSHIINSILLEKISDNF